MLLTLRQEDLQTLVCTAARTLGSANHAQLIKGPSALASKHRRAPVMALIVRQLGHSLFRYHTAAFAQAFTKRAAVS